MKNSMKTLLRTVSAIGALLILSACGNFMDGRGQKQVGSVVDYLYPDAKEAPRMQAGVTYLRPPVRVGLAPEDKGAVQGAANVLSFVGILGAAGVQWLASAWLTSGEVFWACGAAALATGAYAAISRGRFIEAE